jgi:hypothetical protein
VRWMTWRITSAGPCPAAVPAAAPEQPAAEGSPRATSSVYRRKLILSAKFEGD